MSFVGPLESGRSHPLDILNVWSTFEKAAISIELLRIIIMLPLGVLAVVLLDFGHTPTYPRFYCVPGIALPYRSVSVLQQGSSTNVTSLSSAGR